MTTSHMNTWYGALVRPCKWRASSKVASGLAQRSCWLRAMESPKAVGNSGGDVGVGTAGAVALGTAAAAVHPWGAVRVGTRRGLGKVSGGSDQFSGRWSWRLSVPGRGEEDRRRNAGDGVLRGMCADSSRSQAAFHGPGTTVEPVGQIWVRSQKKPAW